MSRSVRGFSIHFGKMLGRMMEIMSTGIRSMPARSSSVGATCLFRFIPTTSIESEKAYFRKTFVGSKPSKKKRKIVSLRYNASAYFSTTFQGGSSSKAETPQPKTKDRVSIHLPFYFSYICAEEERHGTIFESSQELYPYQLCKFG